jgi:hypothetical protein
VIPVVKQNHVIFIYYRFDSYDSLLQSVRNRVVATRAMDVPIWVEMANPAEHCAACLGLDTERRSDRTVPDGARRYRQRRGAMDALARLTPDLLPARPGGRSRSRFSASRLMRLSGVLQERSERASYLSLALESGLTTSTVRSLAHEAESWFAAIRDRPPTIRCGPVRITVVSCQTLIIHSGKNSWP